MFANICLHCGKTWDSTRVAHFCSSLCNNNYRNHLRPQKPKNTYTCLYCGVTKETTKHNVKFCTSTCNHLYHYNIYSNQRHLQQICSYCSTPFVSQKEGVKYCSTRCNNANLDQQRYQNDIHFRLRKILRSRVRWALKTNQKGGSAVKDLGCSVEQLKIHLESLFQPGMSWGNYGRKKGVTCWEIDHVIPLCSFDLSDVNELQRACNYINLQPLWAKDNQKKSNKMPSES